MYNLYLKFLDLEKINVQTFEKKSNSSMDFFLLLSKKIFER